MAVRKIGQRAPVRAVKSIVGPALQVATRSLASRSGADSLQNKHKYPVHLEHQSTHLEELRRKWGTREKPLSLSEKIIYSHIDRDHAPDSHPERGTTYLALKPDRVALQDASAQTAILQFMLAGLHSAAVPVSVHCDHLIVGRHGSKEDLELSVKQNQEIFDFLRSACEKFGFAFWGPGSGIIHQIVLENYALPGGLMLGCDSHTPNAGGLGIAAIGVGGADAVDAMSGTPWELKAPKTIGVELVGELNGWSSPKDVILELAGRLTVKGGTGSVLEYFGKGVNTLSATGMATICNMGAEVGATTSVFPYGSSMRNYLQATNRGAYIELADRHGQESTGLLRADEGCEYDEHIVLDLGQVEPCLNGPFTPDLSTKLSEFPPLAKEKGWPMAVSAALIGSCTNSSYEDMTRAHDLVQQAMKAGLKPKIPFLVTPGSEQIRATCERDGILKTFKDAGATVLANACGPCIGQWDRTQVKEDEPNTILSSFNRNFRRRNDGNSGTHNFLASPDVVTAYAFGADLAKNVMTDEIAPGFKFEPPKGQNLPSAGFDGSTTGTTMIDAKPDPSVEICIDPKSARLQVLEPFEPFHPAAVKNMAVLLKVAGKCTTDAISAAGPWLKYKGHLENISENTLIGAINGNNQRLNSALFVGDGEVGSQEEELSVPEAAKKYKAIGRPWIVIGDENYGEGSAREHAAMQPRFLGGRLIVCRSFARIHETNLKKQGVIPATFADPDDYDKVDTGDSVDLIGADNLSHTSQLRLRVKKRVNGSIVDVPLKHTLSAVQVGWIKAGSALNLVRAAGARRSGTLNEDTNEILTHRGQPI
eukprot:Clim_evm13s239 gene=Clim_evmTU13s239